jgi:hypothetical protein
LHKPIISIYNNVIKNGNGVRLMIIRKFVAALAAGAIIIIIYSIFAELGLALFFGMYLLPILLIYGIPSSILSDFITRRLKGVFRLLLAFLIHIILGALFVLIPTLLFEHEKNIFLSDVSSLLNNFFFIPSIVSAVIYWSIDELIRSNKVRENCKKRTDKMREVLEKIGELRI